MRNSNSVTVCSVYVTIVPPLQWEIMAVAYPAVARDPVLQCVSTYSVQCQIQMWPGTLYYNVWVPTQCSSISRCGQGPCITMYEYSPSAVPYPDVARDPVLQCVSTHPVQCHIQMWPGTLYYSVWVLTQCRTISICGQGPCITMYEYPPNAVAYPDVARDPVLQCMGTHPVQYRIQMWPGTLYYSVLVLTQCSAISRCGQGPCITVC